MAFNVEPTSLYLILVAIALFVLSCSIKLHRISQLLQKPTEFIIKGSDPSTGLPGGLAWRPASPLKTGDSVRDVDGVVKPIASEGKC